MNKKRIAVIAVILIALLIPIAAFADSESAVFSDGFNYYLALNNSASTVREDFTSLTKGGGTAIGMVCESGDHDDTNVYHSFSSVAKMSDIRQTPEVRYFVFDTDIATGDTHYDFKFMLRSDGVNADGKNVGFADSEKFQLKGGAIKGVNKNADGTTSQVEYPLSSKPLDWQHLTLIYDLKGDTAIVFVDGVEVLRSSYKREESIALTRVADLRFNAKGREQTHEGPVSTFVKQHRITVYNDVSEITDCIERRLPLAEYPSYFNYNKYELQKYATPEPMWLADGEGYRELSDMRGRNTAELLYPIEDTVIVDFPITVITNKHTFNYKTSGNIIAEESTDEELGRIIRFTSPKEETDVSWYVGNELILTERVRLGESLTPPKTDKTVIIDGEAMTFVGWATKPAGAPVPLVYGESECYYAIYSPARSCAVVGETASYFYSDTAFSEAINAALVAGGRVIMLEDGALPDLNPNYDLTIDLNGFSLTTTGRITPRSRSTVTLENGHITVTAREIFYLDATSANATAVMKNLTVTQSSDSARMITEVRMGTLVCENTSITTNSSISYVFSTGYRSSASSNASSFTFKDCTINAPNSSLLSAENNSQETNGFTPVINIEGKTSISAKRLLRALTNNSSAENKSKVTINIGGSSVVIITSEDYVRRLAKEKIEINIADGALISLLPSNSLCTLTLGDGGSAAVLTDGGLYKICKEHYTVKWVVADKELTVRYEQGTPPVYPEAVPPVGEGDGALYHYGWAAEDGGAPVTLAPNIPYSTLYALYAAESELIELSWYGEDGELIKTERVKSSCPVAPPYLPKDKVEDGTLAVLSGYSTVKDGTPRDLSAGFTESVSLYAVYDKDSYSIALRFDNGEAKYYGADTVLDMLFNDIDAPAVVTLYRDTYFGENAASSKAGVAQVTVDLNGHTLLSNNSNGRFNLVKNQLLILENGTVKAHSSLIYSASSSSRAIIRDVKAHLLFNHLIDTRGGDITLERVETVPDSSGALWHVAYRSTDSGLKNSLTVIDCDILLKGNLAYSQNNEKETLGSEITLTVKDSRITELGTKPLLLVNMTEAFGTLSSLCAEFLGKTRIDAPQLATNNGYCTVTVTVQDTVRFKTVTDLRGAGLSDVGLAERGEFPYAYTGGVFDISWSADNTEEITERWARGFVPIPPSGEGYAFIPEGEITAAVKNVSYAGRWDIPLPNLYCNLTLHSDLSYNLYLDTVEGLLSVTVGGTEYTELASLPRRGDLYRLTVDGIGPHIAGEDIPLVIRTSVGYNGYTDVKSTLSVPDYIEGVLDGDYTHSAKRLVADLLTYLTVATEAYGDGDGEGYARLSELKEKAAEFATPDPQIPDVTADTSAISHAISSAQLNLASSAHLRFKLNESFSGKITVAYPSLDGEVDYEYEIRSGHTSEGLNYIELDLRAYDLTSEFTLTAGEGSVKYSIAAYYSEIKYTKAGSTVKALFVYAQSAEAYRLANPKPAA